MSFTTLPGIVSIQKIPVTVNKCAPKKLSPEGTWQKDKIGNAKLPYVVECGLKTHAVLNI